MLNNRRPCRVSASRARRNFGCALRLKPQNTPLVSRLSSQWKLLFCLWRRFVSAFAVGGRFETLGFCIYKFRNFLNIERLHDHVYPPDE
jgi:hypothetical protein